MNKEKYSKKFVKNIRYSFVILLRKVLFVI